jgi:hypothetical protein
LQEKGDDLSGKNGKQYFRWFSTSVAYQLAPGSTNLTASLTDLSQWTSVFGEKANESVAATDGFKQAMANLGNVGFSFGGGCFYGHGVRVSGGKAGSPSLVMRSSNFPRSISSFPLVTTQAAAWIARKPSYRATMRRWFRKDERNIPYGALYSCAIFFDVGQSRG